MLVEELKKISLTIQPVGPPNTIEDCQLEFIYGIAGSGLSPLERELHRKSVGDSLHVRIPGGDTARFFGYLYPSLCGKVHLPLPPDELHLRITVNAIAQPEDRELVKAMSQTVSHGCGEGSCDCGCS